ncbi:MAG: SDR family oxidoreductase [Ginsengibacter sp.]
MYTQTIFITGATDGIGRLTAIALSKRNIILVVHGRNEKKLEKLISEIKESSNNQNVDGFIADLSSMNEVRELAKNVMAKHDSIDVLINNAGAGFAAPRYGKDGTEMRLAVNYLAPFLLTNLLMPALKKGATSRIVNVSSGGQSPVNFDDIMLEKNFDGVTAYSQSKLALIMFTIDLAEELKDDGITVNALHPGTYLDTNMVREAGIKPHGKAESGADAEIYLATAPGLKNITGKYFNVNREAKAHAQAYDRIARNRLKKLSYQLAGMEKK